MAVPRPFVSGSTPVPDPTVLTTQQLQREISAARDLIEGKVVAVRDVFDTRLAAMDKAIEILSPQVATKVSNLEALHNEKFRSIATQFLERDTRTEQTSRDSKVAVDAALQAAKEAVGEQNKSNAMAISKSEATFTKQIDQIGVLITTLQKGLDEKIDDVRGRLQILESTRKGASDLWGFLIGAFGVAIAIASLFFRR